MGGRFGRDLAFDLPSKVTIGNIMKHVQRVIVASSCQKFSDVPSKIAGAERFMMNLEWIVFGSMACLPLL